MSTDDGGRAPLDPKEKMRLALERKQQASHRGADGPQPQAGKGAAATHGPAGAKKQFTRRKAGG